MQPIYTQTGNGSAGTITFNNIPQTFTDLKVVISSRDIQSASAYTMMYFRFNGDSSSTNYSSTVVFGYNGTLVASSRDSSTSFIGNYWQPASSSTANTHSNAEMYMPNYTGSNFKSLLIDGVAENNSSSSNALGLTAGLWRNTAAITSISIIGGSFSTTSTFTLYGITKG